MSCDRLLNERPHYASRMMVHPGNGNEVHFAANTQSMTIDGGLTTDRVPFARVESILLRPFERSDATRVAVAGRAR